jgi:hypothetical protein
MHFNLITSEQSYTLYLSNTHKHTYTYTHKCISLYTSTHTPAPTHIHTHTHTPTHIPHTHPHAYTHPHTPQSRNRTQRAQIAAQAFFERNSRLTSEIVGLKKVILHNESKNKEVSGVCRVCMCVYVRVCVRERGGDFKLNCLLYRKYHMPDPPHYIILHHTTPHPHHTTPPPTTLHCTALHYSGPTRTRLVQKRDGASGC